MTKSQEQRMNELAYMHADEYGNIARSDFKYGYQAAIKEAEVLVEALEFTCKYSHNEAINLKAHQALKNLKESEMQNIKYYVNQRGQLI